MIDKENDRFKPTEIEYGINEYDEYGKCIYKGIEQRTRSLTPTDQYGKNSLEKDPLDILIEQEEYLNQEATESLSTQQTRQILGQDKDKILTIVGKVCTDRQFLIIVATLNGASRSEIAKQLKISNSSVWHGENQAITKIKRVLANEPVRKPSKPYTKHKK